MRMILKKRICLKTSFSQTKLNLKMSLEISCFFPITCLEIQIDFRHFKIFQMKLIFILFWRLTIQLFKYFTIFMKKQLVS